jgi:N-acetylglucosamine malate deacetylase 1
MKVLIIAPHPDDESIGCGGSVCTHVKRGDSVAALFLTSGELGLKQMRARQAKEIREAEALRACRVLGIQDADFLRLPDWTMGEDISKAIAGVLPIIQRSKPGLIYLPHANEWHPDHRATLPIVRAVLSQLGSNPKLFGYEVWTPLTEYQHVQNITEFMPQKLRALRKHESQISQWDYVRAVRGLNEYRGAMAGRCRYAEVFQEIALMKS